VEVCILDACGLGVRLFGLSPQTVSWHSVTNNSLPSVPQPPHPPVQCYTFGLAASSAEDDDGAGRVALGVVDRLAGLRRLALVRLS
jgi:hypothetical protein